MVQNRCRVAAILVTLAAPALGLAQTGEMRALAEAFKLSQEELRHYSWTERTEISSDGLVRGTTLARVRYGPEGKLIERPLGERRQRKKAAQLGRSLRELIGSYSRFTPQQMREVFARASIFPLSGEHAALIRVQARNVVREGDTLFIWADSLTYRARKFEIVTSLEGRPVEVVTEFRDLPDGPTHPARMIVRTESKGKTLVITTEHSDYVREGR